LKTLQHKLIDEGLSISAMVVLGAVVLFMLAWCRRRYRRKRRGLPTFKAPSKGHKARGLFGGPSEVLPNDVAQACRTNRAGPVEAWLRRCGSPDARSSEAPRRAVLHIAAAHGAANSCRAALLAGADPNLADDAGDRPLHLAASHGSGACVKVLLDHGADASLQDALGQDAKVRARSAGNTSRSAWPFSRGRTRASCSGRRGSTTGTRPKNPQSDFPSVLGGCALVNSRPRVKHTRRVFSLCFETRSGTQRTLLATDGSRTSLSVQFATAPQPVAAEPHVPARSCGSLPANACHSCATPSTPAGNHQSHGRGERTAHLDRRTRS